MQNKLTETQEIRILDIVRNGQHLKLKRILLSLQQSGLNKWSIAKILQRIIRTAISLNERR